MKVHLPEPRGLAPRLAVLCLPVAAALVLPSALAVAATNGSGSTVRAVVGGDGSVKSVKVYAPDGSMSSFNGSMPLKMSISRSVSGNTSTYTYNVENTFTKTQNVSYTDTAGKSHTFSQTLQLPIVAQLGVEVPKTFKNVATTDGVVLTDPDGTNRVLWNLVLFSPLGSPTQTLTFTATGHGVPTAELAADVVDPATTSGLSSSSQAATANSQQDDFWTSFATGGNGGLSQLSSGMGQIVAGLSKLHDGLGAAVDGANKLDAGTAQAAGGSHQLTTGLGKIHGGQSALTGGLSQISGGLGQLADTKTGLPAASAGVQQLIAGIGAILAGVGDDATAKTLVNGVDLVNGGISALYAGIKASAACTADVLTKLVGPSGGTAPGADPCAPTGLPATPDMLTADPAAAAVLKAPAVGVIAQFQAVAAGTDANLPSAFAQLTGGLTLIHDGLSHPAGAAGPTDLGGVAQGLQAVKAGLGQLQTGLAAANAGISALNTGSQKALSGSQQLTDGSGQALVGSKKLSSGLDQLSAGQHQVAAGLPAAVSGVKQLLDGSTQVKTGIDAVQSGAVAPLQTQLAQGSQNAKKQIAILTATAGLSSQAPGGAQATYVLTQSPNGFALAASTSKSSDNTGRNIGLGLGGLAVLVIAVVAGFSLGRRSSTVSV